MDSAPRQLGQVGRRVFALLALVAVLVSIGATIRPGSAEAFVGENLVINPVTKALTGAAEKVVRKGSYIPEILIKAGGKFGTNEAGDVAAVLQGGRVLPALGAVVAFGVGTKVGSEICHSVLELEGCWYYGSDAADPAPGSGWVWIYDDVIGSGPSETDWQFYAHTGAGTAQTVRPFETAKCQPAPGGMTRFIPLSSPVGCTETPAAKWGYATRSAMANRVLEYHATDNPAISNYPYTPPADWSKQLGEKMVGHSEDAAGKLGQSIAAQIDSSVKDPYSTYVTVPSCDELTWGACKAALEGKELSPVRETLDWDEVVTDVPAEVLTLTPPAGNEVKTGSTVTVVTNPDEAGMPIVVPQPEPGETYDHYAARLNPGLTPERHNLEAAFIDPSVGPNAVVAVSPEPETRLDPATTHKVEVSTNPADVPAPAAGWTPPGISSIDMSPLSGIPSPCSVFPFGLFCWMGEAFAQFNTSGTCPHFEAPVAGTGSDFAVTLCGDTSETIMGYLRPALLLAFIVGCGVMFAKGTRAIGGD